MSNWTFGWTVEEASKNVNTTSTQQSKMASKDIVTPTQQSKIE
jgi:hypothetical protein